MGVDWSWARTGHGRPACPRRTQRGHARQGSWARMGECWYFQYAWTRLLHAGPLHDCAYAVLRARPAESPGPPTASPGPPTASPGPPTESPGQRGEGRRGGSGVVQRLQPSSGDACEAATLLQSPPESVAPACPGRPASARSIGRPGPADIRGMIRPSRIRPVPLPRPLPPYCGHIAAAAAEASPRRRPRRRRRSCHWRRPGRHCSGGVGWTRLKASSL